MVHLVEVTPEEIVALKPAGLASEHTRDPEADSFAHRLAAQGFPGLRLVHRLDAPACGLMLMARSAEAAAHYTREITARRWHKWYVAQVAAPLATAERLVGGHKAYLAIEGRAARVVRAGGKPSFLDVALAAPAPGSAHESQLLVQLHTGRFHQIRVMLADLGAPLSGDVTYGGPPGPTMYLEHVILGARPCLSDEWRVWVAPAHADRPPWAPELSRGIDLRARELAASLAT